jgi:hypothetical protein
MLWQLNGSYFIVRWPQKLKQPMGWSEPNFKLKPRGPNQTTTTKHHHHMSRILIFYFEGNQGLVAVHVQWSHQFSFLNSPWYCLWIIFFLTAHTTVSMTDMYNKTGNTRIILQTELFNWIIRNCLTLTSDLYSYQCSEYHYWHSIY